MCAQDLHVQRVGNDGEDGEGVDQADHDQGVRVVHLETNANTIILTDTNTNTNTNTQKNTNTNIAQF